MDPQQQLRIATHEAGHMVVAMALGCDSVNVTLNPPVTVIDEEPLHHAATIAAGGVAGLTVAGLEYPWEGQEFDVAYAREALNHHITFDEWEELVARAVALISDEPHRARLKVATRILIQRGTVSAEECILATSSVETDRELTSDT